MDAELPPGLPLAAIQVPPAPPIGERRTEGPVGQSDAVAALDLGLRLNAPGYNLYVSGPAGSGRSFTVRSVLEHLKLKSRRSHDRVFVHNFDDPTRPRLLDLPAGRGPWLAQQLEALVHAVRTELPSSLETEAYDRENKDLRLHFEEKERSTTSEFSAAIEADGFTMVAVHNGPFTMRTIAYQLGEDAVLLEALRSDPKAREKVYAHELERLHEEASHIPADEDREKHQERVLAELIERGQAHRDRFVDVEKELHRLEKEKSDALEQLRNKFVRACLEQLFAPLRKSLSELPVSEAERTKIGAHLDAIAAHMERNPELFLDSDLRKLHDPFVSGSPFRRYLANVLQSVTPDDGAPVVFEDHPTWINLFGTIEREQTEEDRYTTDHTKIRGGSLLAADGGFLIIQARDVLLEPGVWRRLIRSLRSEQLEIQSPESVLYVLPSALKPDPMPLDVKIVLIGEEFLYHLLHALEDDFPKTFKVKAEFSSSMDDATPHLEEFRCAAEAIIDRESLRPLSPEGWTALVRFARREAGDRKRLTTRFGLVADLLREANHFSRDREPDADSISADILAHAHAERKRRSSRADREIRRAMNESVLKISTDGARVGQINGLSVFEVGREHFGKPMRITATVGAGRAGIVAIDREVKLTGPSHDKGVMILAGYLRHRYAQSHALAMSAALSFEQSYGPIDGDSASLAELYALLSALSGLPIRQQIAITGSMNQLGDAQAIGGVNEKIEGFYEIWRDQKGTAPGGVIIPASNVPHLILSPALETAVAADEFRIWAIQDIDDGVPVLFGTPPETLDEAVKKRLLELHQSAMREPTDFSAKPEGRSTTPPKSPQIPLPQDPGAHDLGRR